MRKTFIIDRYVAMALGLVLCLLTGSAVRAQSLYQRNLQLAELFETSGNLIMAEQYYQKAIDNTGEYGSVELLKAQIGLVRVYMFWRPVEAQRLNDRLVRSTMNNPEFHQQCLVLNCFISFRLNNTRDFTAANEQYIALCTQNDSLPTTYDTVLQAMKEALNGYYDDALQKLERNEAISPVFRHDVRTIIFKMKGDKDQIIAEQEQRSFTIDSLIALLYRSNQNKIDVTASMTQAEQQAVEHSSLLLKVILALALAIIVMLVVWMNRRKKRQREIIMKNEQLRNALLMANETDQMKTEFVRRVSHEIRTPLNAINGFNDILNNSDIELGNEERADLKERINENVSAITKIVGEMLQVAESESAVEYPKDDNVMCNDFFSKILYSHEHEVNVNILLKYSTRVINRFSILTNADAVREILDHMINNAIKFTSHGTIELNCRQEKNMVLLTLSDTGKGIPADMQDKIFEQFTKVDSFQQGIGLGLTVSRNIARRMGGDLMIDKDYVGGARFVLSLPIK